jgi:hypothetical protein
MLARIGLSAKGTLPVKSFSMTDLSEALAAARGWVKSPTRCPIQFTVPKTLARRPHCCGGPGVAARD